jgi:D-3-phosphoglycerate dehydrogenase
VSELKTKALTASAIAGLLRPLLADVNVVSAPSVAKERGIAIDEVTRAGETDFESLITLSVETESHSRSVSGTVFHDGKPRIISINGIAVDAVVAPVMIYVSNEDKPGFIGRFANILGNAAVNIATFSLGRDREGGSAIALVEVDGTVPEKVLAEIETLPGVKEVKALAF